MTATLFHISARVPIAPPDKIAVVAGEKFPRWLNFARVGLGGSLRFRPGGSARALPHKISADADGMSCDLARALQ